MSKRARDEQPATTTSGRECPACNADYRVDDLASERVPVIVAQCGHTICRKCANDLVSAAKEAGRRTIDCPVCRKRTKVSNSATLAVNAALVSILAAPRPARIFVKTLLDRVYTVDVQPGATADWLKAALSKQMGMPADWMRLIFANKELPDEDPLAMHGLHENDTVYFVQRLRGGVVEGGDVTNH